ncbi:hypothetical protein GCM10009862_18360 [Microbacterium binotii]|uniref:Uncharacterized protein n=1 Tax=Microbacterium binotii TaxID=462710 RepID=A0ABN3PHE2_9MICO
MYDPRARRTKPRRIRSPVRRSVPAGQVRAPRMRYRPPRSADEGREEGDRSRDEILTPEPYGGVGVRRLLDLDEVPHHIPRSARFPRASYPNTSTPKPDTTPRTSSR